MNKYYYAVQFRSGRGTTTGQPNPRTWRMNRAVNIEVFLTPSDRDKWVENGKITTDMAGNCREPVTRKQLRALCLGMSMQEFSEYVESLQTLADNED